MRYPSTPEVIGTISEIPPNGNERHIGDRIVGISVSQSNISDKSDAEIQVDIRGYPGRTNITIKMPLQDVMAAITSAMLNKEQA